MNIAMTRVHFWRSICAICRKRAWYDRRTLRKLIAIIALGNAWDSTFAVTPVKTKFPDSWSKVTIHEFIPSSSGNLDMTSSPRISGDRATYCLRKVSSIPPIAESILVYSFDTDNTSVISSGGFYGFCIFEIPTSDIDNNWVIYPKSNEIYAYDLVTKSESKVADRLPNSLHEDIPAIGGNTVAWMSDQKLRVKDRATGNTNVLASYNYQIDGHSINGSAAVAQNGSVVAWSVCKYISSYVCSVWTAVKSTTDGSWTLTEVANNVTTNANVATNGEIVVYIAPREAGVGGPYPEVCWQPVGGGNEDCLNLAGYQSWPSIYGNLIAFTNGTTSEDAGLSVFDLNTLALYQFPRDPNNTRYALVPGGPSDISVSPSGQVRLVYQNVMNIYGVSFTLDQPPTNQAPIANAGQDQSGEEGTLITLDATSSSDPENSTLTYEWKQMAGPNVALNLTDPAKPSFYAPNVPRGGSVLTLSLTVNDGELTSEPDTVDITIKDVNHPPVSDAGSEQTVKEESSVVLDGSSSYDQDNDPLTFSWKQIGESTVTLADIDTTSPSFTTPLVGPAGASLTFELTVDDGIATATDSVVVNVENVNHAPIADAGSDQTTDEGGSVTLNGSGKDPDNDSLTYEWTQISGPMVILSDVTSPTPTFTAPQIEPGGETLEFELVVRDDGLMASDPDRVTVHILDNNDPPACEQATASPSLIWPPNRRLESVGIIGVSDPNDDQVTVTVTSVKQDESVTDGGITPDGIIQNGGALLRAERAGNGNGRVYALTFKAEDSDGASCTGTVTVCVPRDRQSDQCVNSGEIYDSQQP